MAGQFLPSAGRRLCRLLALGPLGLCATLAQAQPSSPLPEALKDIKPAGGVCLRDGAASPAAPVPAKTGTVRPDLGCAIAPAELSGLLERPDMVMADVRPAADYAAFHMDGALNATASQLRTKPFLRGKTLVLIGNGKAERELYADCARLKANGFKKTKVLRGGLPAWLSSGQAVLGRPPATTLTALLGQGELWAETRFDANLVLVAPTRKDMLRELPAAVLIPDASPAALQAAIKQHRGKSKSPLAAVVLVAADSQASSLPSLRQAIQPVPLLAYADTAEAYTRQLARQQAIWTAQERGPKQPACGR